MLAAKLNGGSESPASVRRKRAFLPSPEYHVIAKKKNTHWHSRTYRTFPGFMLHASWVQVSRRIFWLAFFQRGSGCSGLGRDSHEKGSEFVALAAHSGLCRTTGCRSPVLFSYEGHVIFAPYLRMRSVAPLSMMLIVFLWEANSSSMGVSTWTAYCHTDRLGKFTGYMTVLYSPIQPRVSRYGVCTTAAQ
jgi:hypothetical protein